MTASPSMTMLLPTWTYCQLFQDLACSECSHPREWKPRRWCSWVRWSSCRGSSWSRRWVSPRWKTSSRCSCCTRPWTGRRPRPVAPWATPSCRRRWRREILNQNRIDDRLNGTWIYLKDDNNFLSWIKAKHNPINENLRQYLYRFWALWLAVKF